MISYCYTENVVVNSNSETGGLVANLGPYSSIDHSYAINPTVTATNSNSVKYLNVGGLVGSIGVDTGVSPNVGANITDSYVIGGSVKGIDGIDTLYGGAGGFVGAVGGVGTGSIINRSFVYGTAISGGGIVLGGFIGWTDASITNSFAAATSISAATGITIAPFSTNGFLGSFDGANYVGSNNYYLSTVGDSDGITTGISSADLAAPFTSNLMPGITDDSTNWVHGTLHPEKP